MRHGGDARIAVVVRPLDRVLGGLKFGLAPALVLLASLPTLSGLINAHVSGAQNWAVILVALAAALAYIYVIQTESISRRVDRLIAGIRRRVAMACNHTYRATHEDSRIACRLTPELLRAPIFRYEQQRDAVSRLVSACTDSDAPRGRFWFLEGESGSGKTRTALLLVQSLVRDPDHFELGSRCFLYDFRASPTTQRELLDHLGSSRHDGAVVFVDNFQLVRAAILSQLTDCLIDNPRASARLVVFLTRPSAAWNLGGGSDVRLLSAAKANNRYLTLAGPAVDTVENSVSDIDRGVSRLVGNLEQSATASAAQLHLAQVIARNHAVAPEVLSLLHLLTGDSDAVPSSDLVRVTAIVSALSMHRGGFNRRELLRAIRVATPEPPGLRSMVGMLTTFRRFHKIGLVPKSEQEGPRYIFHEGVAEHCIDRLTGIPAFNDTLVAIGRARLRRASTEASDAWLIAAEIGEQDVMHATFDEAMANGSYDGMVRCLARANTRYVLAQLTRLQLAILLNRTGSFVESRRMFGDDSVEALTSSGGLALMLLTSRMEATHDARAERALPELCESDDPLVSIIGEYWQIHMKAHRGFFDSQRLLGLAAQARDLLGAGDSYWLTFSIARMHFDSLRHYYLEGGGPVSSADAQTRRELDRYLKGHLTTFEGLHILYTQAHLVGHILLPRLAIFKELASPDEAARAGIQLNQARAVEGLVGAAQRLYQRAADEFSQYGDREALYLRADILNLRMVADDADLDKIEACLNEYAAFGAANFKLIASYPHFYRLRWHMLKFYDLMMTHADFQEAGRHRAAARRQQEIIKELDTQVGNEYGMLRAELLGVLLDISEGQQDEMQMAQLHQRMIDHSYGFEARLLQRLMRPHSDTISDLREVIRFYPFIHQ
jgi:hypothetical protein